MHAKFSNGKSDLPATPNCMMRTPHRALFVAELLVRASDSEGLYLVDYLVSSRLNTECAATSLEHNQADDLLA